MLVEHGDEIRRVVHERTEAIRLAERIVGLAYSNMAAAYFTTGGAESNESAFKFARYYWKRMGKPEKVKIISRVLYD